MKRIFSLTILFVCISIAYSQEKRTISKYEMDSISCKMEGPNALFINGELYLVDCSPLKYVKNDDTYKDIFRDGDKAIIHYQYSHPFDGRRGYNVWGENGTYWSIEDNKLYLDSVRLDFYYKGIDYDTRCAKMENFTGCKFNDSGKMFAGWVTGEIWAKKENCAPRSKDFDEEEKNFEKWLYAPLTKLVFKNGVLVATEIVSVEEERE